MTHCICSCKASISDSRFSLWWSNNQIHVKPFFLITCHRKTLNSHFKSIMRTLGRSLLTRFSLESIQFFASFHDDLKSDPSLYPIFHNFPTDSSLQANLINVFSLSPVSHLSAPLFGSPAAYASANPPKAQRVFVFPGGSRGNLATGKAVIISFQSLSWLRFKQEEGHFLPHRNC